MRCTARFAVLSTAAAVLAIVGLATPAFADTTISATGSTNCSSGQLATAATFTLSGVANSQEISVQTALSTLVRSPSSVSSGNIATYDVTLDAKYQNATAIVPSMWSGSFRLVSATCQTAHAAGVNAQGSLPGINPVSIAAHISNSNDIMVSYMVSVGGIGSKPVQVLAHETQEVDFAAACGKRYTITARDTDGYHTSGSGTTTTVACPQQPAPPATSHTQPASPRRTAGPASASPSPTASASATNDPSSSSASPSPYGTEAAAAGNAQGPRFALSASTMFILAGMGLTVAGAFAFVYIVVRAFRQRRHVTP